MEKFAESMKKSAQKRSGDDKICEVGEVVHVALKNEDKAKVDLGNLTRVIVKVDKSRCQARVAVKLELLKSWYARPSDWKGQQCRIEWLDRRIEWVRVNEDHP